MKMRRLLLSILLCFSLSALALTDEQVIAYIKQQSAAGKTEQEIGKALLAKGVTPEQAKRIKAKYQKQLEQEQKGNKSKQQPNLLITDDSDSRLRRRRTTNTTDNTGRNNQNRNNQQRNNQNQQRNNQNQQRNNYYQDNYNGDFQTTTLDGIVYGYDPETGEFNDSIMMYYYPQEDVRQIYGHDIFKNNTLTFEPNENLATPQNYRLGPGDEVIIDIWGNSEDHLRETISPEGSIMIDQIGPVYLNGLTISDANKHVKNAFAKKYAGVTDAETNVQLTLGQVRSIQIDIMGEVETPGTFQMSPFSSVFHALYNAGGINDIGSLRNIQVLRNGKKVAGVDLYQYLFEGKANGNIRLQEGDVIIVPPYEQLVNIEGNVKRPMYYEIKPGETINSILNYSGGFTGDAYGEMIRLARQTGTENELYNIDKEQFETYKLKDGDVVTVGSILDRYANRVEVKGAVFRPGLFSIGKQLNTVGELIGKAEGLTEDAYTQRAILYREGPELQLQVVALDLGAILNGTAPDIELKRNDLLVVSSLTDIEDRGILTINGEIALPGEYPYAENMTLEDLILEAGGLLEGASTARVNISRRIINPSSVTPTEQLSESFTVSIDGGLAYGQGEGFILKPYDVVHVRKSPGYSEQEQVELKGEILFTGEYSIEKRNERISSFINRAGGLIEGAYVKGAQLTRKLTEDEYKMRQETLRMAMQNSTSQGDSIAVSKIEVADNYSVGIDLEMALANPGSTYDVVLKPGDVLYVPEIQSTVKIAGEVMFPNTVVYVPGKKLEYYVNQAGGYGQQAKKGKAFVVYMNGSVAKAKNSTPIEPGCQIIVPAKPANSSFDWTKVLALATSLGSVATMAATVANLFRK